MCSDGTGSKFWFRNTCGKVKSDLYNRFEFQNTMGHLFGHPVQILILTFDIVDNWHPTISDEIPGDLTRSDEMDVWENLMHLKSNISHLKSYFSLLTFHIWHLTLSNAYNINILQIGKKFSHSVSDSVNNMDLRNASASGNLTRWMVYQCFSPWCLIALWCIYDIQDFVDILQIGFQLLPS